MKDSELLFIDSIKDAVSQTGAYNGVNVVIGIPVDNNNKVTLPEVLKVLDKGLAGFQSLRKSLIVCVGDHSDAGMLESVRSLDLKVLHLEFPIKYGYKGRGMKIRTILEIANLLEADAVIYAADLAPRDRWVPQPGWVERLIEPIRREYDFVITDLQRGCIGDLMESMFISPLLEVFYGYNIRGTLSGVYAMSHDTVEDLCTDIKFWPGVIQGFGIDHWMVSRVVRWNKKICEVQLSSGRYEIPIDRLESIFKESVRSLFECIKWDEDYWIGSRLIIRTPDIYGREANDLSVRPDYSIFDLSLPLENHSPDRGSSAASLSCPDEFAGCITPTPDDASGIKGITWAGIVYGALLKYWFTTGVCKDDLLDALTYAFKARLSCFIEHIRAVVGQLDGVKNIDTGFIFLSEAASAKEEQRKDFLSMRKRFIHLWEKKGFEMKPPLVPAHYLEVIPGIPVVLPKRIEGWGGKVVFTEEMFNRLQTRYQKYFTRYIHNGLGLPENANSTTVVNCIKEFLGELEKTLEWLLPGDLYTEEGISQVVDGIFRIFHAPRSFSVKNEIFREMLLRFPPLNVIIPAGYKNSRELIEKMDVRDAVSLAALVETRKYGEGSALLWMLDSLKPEGMGEVQIRPMVLGEKLLGGTVKLSNISELNKLTSRIVIGPLSRNMAGDYPRLRFTLFVSRHIMIAENYNILWRTFAKERKNLGGKIRNTLVGRYESIAFSAHDIFENFHHRTLVRHFRALSRKLAGDGHKEKARLIKIMCDGYGLSQVFADGAFLPCSAWSWASYSYKGGKGVPPPLSSHVEENWFYHDFLEEIYKELGYEPGEIMKTVIQLIGEGRASENLLDVLLGIKAKDITVIVQEHQDYPVAKPLTRYAGNPLLSPIREHPWESKYVLNTAAFRVKDRVYLLYRAYGDDGVSRIGLAVTDGYKVLGRLKDPVFVPQDETEKKGVEDPRVVIIDNKLFMLYTAYDGAIAQISAASIKLNDLLDKRYDKWERKGLAFKDIWDKDAILFPEKVNGKYIIYHRIEPSIWVSHLDKLEFPAPKEKHSIILGPRPGLMWDSLKIGAGAQPIKTIYGWLLIYHGVDQHRVYRLGVILTDLANPERLLYRSPNPVLSPETEYEIGKKGESWVPNVVFTCGAVPAEDKDILDAGDSILVYYGAADTHVCLATGMVGDLIPESARGKH